MKIILFDDADFITIRIPKSELKSLPPSGLNSLLREMTDADSAAEKLRALTVLARMAEGSDAPA